jgi:hypothetical protein
MEKNGVFIFSIRGACRRREGEKVEKSGKREKNKASRKKLSFSHFQFFLRLKKKGTQRREPPLRLLPPSLVYKVSPPERVISLLGPQAK